MENSPLGYLWQGKSRSSWVSGGGVGVGVVGGGGGGGSMNDNDAQRRLQMLKTTAYRAQYLDWLKLLHLHAAVLGKIESGLATWDTNFEQVGRMVPENPGKVDWSARLGMRQHKSGRKGTGVDRPGNTRAVSTGMTKTLPGGAGTSSPAHVSKLHHTTKHQREGGDSATHMRQVLPKGRRWA